MNPCLVVGIVLARDRIYEERFRSKWRPRWRSVIAKYEAASQRDVGDTDSDGEVER